MNFFSLILEFLKANGQVSFRGFGTFLLKSTGASLDQEIKSISPPGKEIVFDVNAEDHSDGFLQFISQQKNISLAEAQVEIDKQVTFWNTTLEKEKEVTLENVGSFYLSESTLHFTGKKVENSSPDFYGLEEINLAEIKKTRKSTSKKEEKEEYRFSSSIWWIILLFAGISALTYFGITQPETLFSKKSFQNLREEKPVPQKTNTAAIEKTLLALQDSVSLSAKNLDSTRIDSLQSVSIPLKSTPKK
ncbi:hypothetical protein [Chryseobacterium sp. MP_3.2]|uniref:hypothetical protein n=1 Tax=Chryseobacterium sp. MP_3.2 TaxID=3071712 RepID=UPI002DF74B07|nr:nucleoid DNA-binding protein [Chryseobacterium sp. MP_3.2]